VMVMVGDDGGDGDGDGKGFWGGKKKLKIHQPQRFDSQKRKCDK